MIELINKDIRMFYKERKDTKAINQMINCYQVLVNSIDALNITGGKNQYQNEVKTNTIKLVAAVKQIDTKQLKKACQVKDYRKEMVQRIINVLVLFQKEGIEAGFEEFLFINESRIEADFYRLSTYLLKELALGKVDLNNHKKAITICQKKQDYLNYGHKYMDGYYKYISNYQNSEKEIELIKMLVDMDQKAYIEGYSLFNLTLHDKKTEQKVNTFKNLYYISNINIIGSTSTEKSFSERLKKNSFADDTKWRLEASKAYNLLVSTINEKNPGLIQEDIILTKRKK